MLTLGKCNHGTLEERLELYRQANLFRTQGLPAPEIAERLGVTANYVYWLWGNRPSREGYVPDLTPRPDLAYLTGAYLGDGRTAGEADRKVRFKVADRGFAELLNYFVAKILRTKPRRLTMEEEFHCVNHDSAVLYDYLQQPLERLLPVIESWPAAFLRGFFDAEGYVSPSLDHESKHFLGIMLGVVNTNPDYLGCVRRLLGNQGIQSTFRTTQRRRTLCRYVVGRSLGSTTFNT